MITTFMKCRYPPNYPYEPLDDASMELSVLEGHLRDQSIAHLKEVIINRVDELPLQEPMVFSVVGTCPLSIHPL